MLHLNATEHNAANVSNISTKGTETQFTEPTEVGRADALLQRALERPSDSKEHPNKLEINLRKCLEDTREAVEFTPAA